MNAQPAAGVRPRVAGPAGARAPVAETVAVIHGAVTHRRARPARHAFTYPAFCLRVPLSRLEELDRHGIAHNRHGIVSFRDRDYGPGDGTPLLPWIRSLLAAEGIAADGEIVLFAFPRMLGYVFNPVSFWVCHDAAGAARAVLCDVRNTFGERHRYLLAGVSGAALASGQALTARKVFHVSPFCEVAGHYAFRFHFGDRLWLARIDYFDRDDAAPLLETWISGVAEACTPATVRRLPRRYPLFTLGVIARIHWQAFLLWTKRVPFFAKPPPPVAPLSRGHP